MQAIAGATEELRSLKALQNVASSAFISKHHWTITCKIDAIKQPQERCSYCYVQVIWKITIETYTLLRIQQKNLLKSLKIFNCKTPRVCYKKKTITINKSYIFIIFGKFITTYMRMKSFGSYHNILVYIYGYIIISCLNSAVNIVIIASRGKNVSVVLVFFTFLNSQNSTSDAQVL